ncbi:MAG: GAF domain-containing protein, partial [Deltaproteobacteria bacterium]|nr:GAF domain-containing protein [Deltaproteobacteria bacterium]
MTDNINNTNTCSAAQHQLNTLQRVDGFMNSIADLDHLLEQIMRESRRATGAESCSLALYNPATHDFSFEIVLGDKSPETKQERVRYGEGIIGLVAQTGTPQNIPDVYADKSFTPRFDQKTGFKTRNLLAVPMSRRSKLIGVIEVLNKASAEGFSSDDQSLLELLAHQAAIAIENARLYSASLSKERLASLGEGISGAAHCIKNIANLISF